MGLMGLGTWYHPRWNPSPQRIARANLLLALERLRPQAVEALRRDVLPVYLSWHEERMFREVRDAFSEFPEGHGEPAPGAADSDDWAKWESLLPRAPTTEEYLNELLRWCQGWNLPPRPRRVLDLSGERAGERWLFEQVAEILHGWAARDEGNPLHPTAYFGTDPADDTQIGLWSAPSEVFHPKLPAPPLEGVRPWRPTLEPWDREVSVTEADGRSRVRIGYLPLVRKRYGLSHREARRVLSPYKQRCERHLTEHGYRRVTQKLPGWHGYQTHFDWFVRFQVPTNPSGQCETLRAIAEDPIGDRSLISRDVRSVRDALKNMAELLPLTRRTAYP